MATLRILHASDLHISEFENLRSPIDHFADLRDPSRTILRGVFKGFRTLPELTSHVRKRLASSYSSEPLLALSKFIYQNGRRKSAGEGAQSADALDAVILTGDIATTGEIEDIEQAARFLKARANPRIPYKAVEEEYRGATLSRAGIPIIVLPGNHDRYEETWEWRGKVPIVFKPAGTNFDKVIANYAAPKKPVFAKLLSTPIDNSRNLRVVLICADFSLQDISDADENTHMGWLAQGKVYSDIRKRLVDKTIEVTNVTPESDVLCVLWAVHFPPFFPGVKKHSQLLGEQALINLANDLEVRGILAGHTHQQLQYQTPGMRFFGLCCGTTTQCEPQALIGGLQQHNVRAGNHFQILNISAEPTSPLSLTVEHYRYSATTDDGPAVYEWQRV